MVSTVVDNLVEVSDVASVVGAHEFPFSDRFLVFVELELNGMRERASVEMFIRRPHVIRSPPLFSTLLS